MFTHQMPDGPVRRGREELYRTRPEEILPALRILSQSRKPILAEFGQHWLTDYQLWIEHQKQKQAA